MHATTERPRLGVADVVRAHGAAFLARHGARLTHEQRRALEDIEQCRTAKLGGHVEVYSCGHEVTAYNSCRNRHCPKCLAHKAHEWVEKKERDLLPVPYFHVVFTMPAVLADVDVLDRSKLYEALFAAASATLLEVGRRRLDGELGFIGVLHTWGQTLTHHPHLHCVVAGAALDVKKRTVTMSRQKFLLPVRVLSTVFRAKMLEEVRKRGVVVPPAATKSKWVVYAKPPFGGPAQVLRYLARYTHRVAIGDRRIEQVDDAGVVFRYRDRQHGQRSMRLDGVEWLRRFTNHVLPRGFVRLRSYGFLSNAAKKTKLGLLRELLHVDEPKDPAPEPAERVRLCPLCKEGVRTSLVLLPSDAPTERPHDTS